MKPGTINSSNRTGSLDTGRDHDRAFTTEIRDNPALGHARPMRVIDTSMRKDRTRIRR